MNAQYNPAYPATLPFLIICLTHLSKRLNSKKDRTHATLTRIQSDTIGMSDFPKRRDSFNPKAYRSQAAHDAHLKAHVVASVASKPGSGNTSSPSACRGPARDNDDHSKPHFMSNAEVKQWFSEAEADYERDKKVRAIIIFGFYLPEFEYICQ